MAPRQRMDLLQTTEASYDEVMGVNLKGPFFLTQHVANVMINLLREQRISQPKIINIGSMSAYTASVNRGEYCISKAGMGMMTALFADRLAEYGILVYEIRPGVINTDMTSVVKARYDALIDDGLTPVRRWGEPEDVARAVLAVVEGYLPFSTGEIINVDGGFHLRRL
jgi:NAD(P)-dependent dehydrogenase (short-subunit alcohol dehydrogenase family)